MSQQDVSRQARRMRKAGLGRVQSAGLKLRHGFVSAHWESSKGPSDWLAVNAG